MKITHVIRTRFPVQGYGGTERVCYYLMKAQAEMGHEISVLCEPGSELPFAKTYELPEEVQQLDAYLPKGTEVVQLYGTPNYQIHTPYLVNIGGNGQAGERFPSNTVFVSANHAKRHGWTEFVHNGIDIEDYPFEAKRENYLLFLAKASWRVKNLPGAIRIAQKSHCSLYVAGGKTWFRHRGVKSFGMVDGAQKLRLMQKAKGLLFPVIWEEPFGLAVIEALATGSPVVATPRGGLPEIITPLCGVLGDSFEELVNGVHFLCNIHPEECRERVKKHFTHHRMAEKYLSYYKTILTKGCLREGYPVTPGQSDPQEKIYYKNYERTLLP